MKKQIKLSSVLILIAVCVKAQTVDLVAERTELIKADKAWSIAAKTHNMEKLWTFWTEDAKILMSADKTIEGMDQIKKFTTQARTDPNFEISWEVLGADVSISGDMGFTYGIGKVTRTKENGDLMTMTKPYLAAWKKQPDGKWKCVIEY